jgi:hypothetical protein
MLKKLKEITLENKKFWMILGFSGAIFGGKLLMDYLDKMEIKESGGGGL